MKKTIGFFIAAVLMFSSLALPSLSQESQAQAKPEIKLKSEGAALALALAGTLLPWGLAALAASNDQDGSLAWLGLLAYPLGPSLGYFYAGSSEQALGGIGIRALGVGAFLAGIAIAWDEGDQILPAALVIGGGVVYVASTIYDLAGVTKAVRKNNARAGRASLNVVPVLSPKSKTVGLSVQLAF
jgi:hypothetical protein